VTDTARLIDVAIVGGGMITHDQILPSVYHLQRLGQVRAITVCARHNAPLRALKASGELRDAFPGADFTAFPAFSQPADRMIQDAHRLVIAQMAPRQLVIVAVPDAAHHEVVMEALRHDQHVICVKPLVQRHDQAVEIATVARQRGLFVGVEYHKRFDRRALVARRQYAEGRFGEFVMGEARLHEPYAYRRSNFQNWFTCDQADPFTYVGCHYVDLVGFITGLQPVSVSVDAVKGKFPNGNEGYLWSSARVRYENGALLTVTNALGYPDKAAGSNDQGLVMYCEGPDGTGMIHHDDHERGVRYSYLEPAAGAHYRYVSPDYFRLAAWEGPGYKPVGYGFDSVAALVNAALRIEADVASLDETESLTRRQELLRQIDDAGLLATPANSSSNERVIEAARASLANGGRTVDVKERT
jgi:D-galacturonate reductase